MTEHHPPDKLTARDPARLVVLLHGSGDTTADPALLSPFAAAGLRVFSHRKLEGTEAVRAKPAALGDLCGELAERAPAHAVLFLDAGLEVSAPAVEAIAALVRNTAGPGAYTAFSNADPELNPFAGLAADGTDAEQRERLVALLGEGRLLPVDHWPEHLLLLTADAVQALAVPGLDRRGASGLLRSRHVQPEVADWIWAEAPGRPANADTVLEPHEERRPRPWGALTERLHAWLERLAAAPISDAAIPRPGSAPVTLHITHSWGGGVATWVRSFIEGDPGGLHLQLRSEGPQAGDGAGQRLSLYLANELGAPIAQWWLQPPIRAVEAAHGQYREVLDQVCRRFGVGRVIVSSLVGHGLDALRTELPTIQVLHDAFPAWPLLGIHPEEFDGDLAAAMQDPRASEPFPEPTLEDWRRIAEPFAEAARDVIRVAPSEAARRVQASVEPGLEADRVQVVPHGLPPLPLQRIRPRRRADGRLSIVIPGRVQTGKGAALLEAALPRLRAVAQITLLGTGKGGERFFGQGGVNVVPQYDREDLAATLQAIGPDLALLPSTVPETFSYTLSEMQALGVPVLATRVGSFAERIEDGADGWLTDTNPDALAARVEALAADPATVDAVRRRVAGLAPHSVQAMIEAYDTLCPARARAPARPVWHGAQLDLAQAQAASGKDQLQRLRVDLERRGRENAALQDLVRERTQWAEDEKRQRKTWVASLEAELQEARGERDAVSARANELENELADRAAHIASLDRHIDELGRRLAHAEPFEQRYEDTRRTLDQVLASHSWKLTRPLRVSRRVAANFMHQRAWNPLRWPLLLSQAVRNLSTVGLSGTLRRMQRFAPDAVAPASDLAVETVAVPESIVLPASLPVSETPLVSVIIPAYNHLAHTAACLASLAETACTVPFEVLVVDDASSDDTPERVPGVKGARFLRNEENLGFIGTCNRGADAARGEFVLFLNNDTQVREGWLEALVETFGQRQDAGLVGARLVYPDGSLQECGGIVFSDGSGWNYGRGDDPDRPEYQYLREVDYCSGACIMLRKALFEELGGFDTHYAPAYYEDTDLAFKVRDKGLKVFVQPRATIIHFEGVTSGTDLSSGAKRYQVVNREKFRERWKGQLARQPAPIENPHDLAAVRRARDHHLAGRVLVVDAYTPEPDQDSGSVRLVNFMRCLQALGYGVTFFPDNRAWNGSYTRALQNLGVEAWYDPWLQSADRFLEAHGPDFTLVVVSRHYVACNYLAPVRRHAPRARFVFDTVDLHYLREQRLAELEDSATLRQVAKQTRRSELAVIRDSDATLVVSPVEQEFLAEEAPDARVFVLSNIHEVTGSAADFDTRKDLYFVGGYQHPPNIDAAHWFVEDIWPQVRERLPGARFHLVGSKAPDDVRALGEAEGVTFHGFVESVAPFLDGCRLAVAPLRYGAGVKGKVNQAMAHGQPVVATTAAVEGLHAVDGEDVLVADDAKGFADAVVRLYEDADLWRRLSRGGVANVEAHFSAATAQRDIQRLIDALTGQAD